MTESDRFRTQLRDAGLARWAEQIVELDRYRHRCRRGVAAFVDLDDQAGELPLGIPPAAPNRALDVALGRAGVPADVDVDPPTLLAPLLDMPTHGCLPGR